MRRYWLAGLPMATAGLMALISGLLAGPSQAREVDDPAAASAPATPILLSGALSSVATISPDNAWAAGSASLSTSRPLIMHWNGKAWTKSVIPISANGAIGALYAVSANDVWAVGDTSGTITHPLLLHWNGHRWSRPAGVPSVAG